MGGIPAVPPTPYQNPVLDELDRLSPQAKTALARAHQSIASVQQPPEMAPAPMQSAQVPGAPARLASPPSYTPKPLGGTPAPAPGAPPPMTADQQAHTDERNRLIASGSGLSQVHNPFLKTLGTIGDVLGSTFAPRAAAYIPGTTLHHEMLLGDAQKSVNSDEAQREAEGKVATDAAQAGHLQSQIPEIQAETALKQADLPIKQTLAEEEQTKAGALPQTLADESAVRQSTAGKNQAETKKLETDAAPFEDATRDQLNGMLQQRWKVLHGDTPMPSVYQLGPKANKVDWERVDKALEGTEKALGTKAQQDQSAELRRQSLAMAGQNHAESVALRREQMELAKEGRDSHTDTAQRTASLKAYQPALDSAERFNVMTKNFEDAVKDNNQQAMLSLLANHIGMTLGAQKGARITKDILHEAETSAPWMAKMKTRFDKDGVLSGVTLTPDQMKQMVGLGRERFSEDLAKSKNQAQYLGATDQGPARTPNAATMGFYIHEAKGDVNKAKQLAGQDGWTVEGAK